MANSHKLVAQADAHAPAVHASTHQTGGSDAVKIDDLAAGDDNTDLNVSTTKHGLTPKVAGSDGDVLTKSGTAAVWSTSTAGSVATDAIWDAAGDLVQGTGANTSAKLSAGTTGNVLTSAGAAAANTWKYPPGYELSYVEFTSSVSITNTSEGAADVIVTAASVTFDGTAVWIEGWAPFATASVGGTRLVIGVLWDDTAGASIGKAPVLSDVSAANDEYGAFFFRRRLTPAAGARVYSWRAFATIATATIAAGAGGSGNYLPGYIRITKA